jgi:hypothetical protein
MAKQAPKRINVSGTVTPELHEFIENHRWTNRMSKSDVINKALEDWGKANGFEQPETEPEATEPEAEVSEPVAAGKGRRR